MASLGHHRGVAAAMGITLRGFLAWWLRRSYYLLVTPRMAQRVRLVADWTIGLFFHPSLTKVDLNAEGKCCSAMTLLQRSSRAHGQRSCRALSLRKTRVEYTPLATLGSRRISKHRNDELSAIAWPVLRFDGAFEDSSIVACRVTRLILGPFGEKCCQTVAPRSQLVIVIAPLSDSSIIDAHDGRTSQEGRHSALQKPIR
jgi:hypothetical protein